MLDIGKELLGDLVSQLIDLSRIHLYSLMIMLFLTRSGKLFVNISVVLHPSREDRPCLSLVEAHHHHHHHFIATVDCGGGLSMSNSTYQFTQIPYISLVSYISLLCDIG